MKIYASEEHRKHFPEGELYGGKLVRPFECPERWDYIAEQVTQRGIGEIDPPDTLDFAPVEAIHNANYLEFLRNAWAMWAREGFDGEAIPTVVPARRMQQREPEHIDGKLGYYCMALETAITSGTWQAACSSAAVAITAARNTDNAHAAFGLCRPPGHHAASDLYGGYCFLNNAAIAAQDLLHRGAARVAILDVDFHHGNGTQDIFYQRDDVLFVSLHGRPEDAFPHFLGYADETGEGAGDGFNVNLPMRPGSGFDIWSAALDDGLKAIRTFAPDALVVSLGVDTFESDPISFFKLKSDDFTTYGETIARAGLPTVFIMEGGYAVEEIGINTANVLNGYLQRRGA